MVGPLFGGLNHWVVEGNIGCPNIGGRGGEGGGGGALPPNLNSGGGACP